MRCALLLLCLSASLRASLPVIEAIYPVTPNTLAVRIQEGFYHNEAQVDYVAEAGDALIPVGPTALFWEAGQIQEGQISTRLNRGGNPFAYLTQLNSSSHRLMQRDYGTGNALSGGSETASYELIKQNNQMLSPLYVSQKTRLSRNPDMGWAKPKRHLFYLEFPEALEEGHAYTLRLPGLNTSQTTIPYTHDLRHSWSEAVHVNHFGFWPDSGFKRAYLSLWKGSHGPQEYEETDFYLLDAQTREEVYSGTITLGFAATEQERMKGSKNHVQAPVYYLDFEAFTTEGEYVVYVPGVGCSYPFTIGTEIYQVPFTKAMQGFLAHRSGIDLTATVPELGYNRPRPMHPKDGIQVFELSRTRLEGEASLVNLDLKEQLEDPFDASALTLYGEHGWGGYMDAGDWDRRSQHLDATYLHLELYDLFPNYFAQHSLLLPSDESNDAIPDIVNEALWNLDFYRRLQEPHGGVRGGIESTAHPRKGETSWQETLLLGVFSPDPVSSMSYAACAAKAAHLLRSHDPALADLYEQSAKLAYDWAQSPEGQAVFDTAQARYAVDKPNEHDPAAAQKRASWEDAYEAYLYQASVELYRLTEEPGYHELLTASNWTNYANEAEANRLVNAAFTYCLLPEEQTDPNTRAQAEAFILERATMAQSYGQGNAFNLASHVVGMPMMGYTCYYSVPEFNTSPVLPRAYYLTKDEAYLNAAIGALQFSTGANPNNMTYTTGVGHDYPRAVLHLDSIRSGQEAPVGITVFGSMDPEEANSWAIDHHLNGDKMVPSAITWPAAEFYVGNERWPMMNEYSITKPMRMTSYYWGFMAAVKQEHTSDLMPKIELEGNGVPIVSGDDTPSWADRTRFGSVEVGAGTRKRSFVIRNTGNAELLLAGSPTVQLIGDHASDFSISLEPASSISADEQSSFEITFAPSAVGDRQVDVMISSNDLDEGSYRFAIMGHGQITDAYLNWQQSIDWQGQSSAMEDDPDGDGLSNLLEYALNSDPVDRASAKLPTISVEASALQLRFTRIADPDLTYEVFASKDLHNWSNSPIWSSSAAENTDGLVVVQDIEGLEGTRFLRLSVTR